MPADFYIDVQRQTVFSKAVGIYSAREAFSYMDRLSQHPDFRPQFNQLMDCRDVTSVTLTGADVRKLSEMNLFSASSRRAFVVVLDYHFGLGRMFETLREMQGEEEIRLFREMPEALDWLSLPEESDPAKFASL